jgi:hypothetical protein
MSLSALAQIDPRDRQNSGISRLAIGTRVQGSFLFGSLGVGMFGFIQSVGTPLSLE